MVTIPNRTLMEKGLINYTKDTPYIMQDVYLLISFDSDRNKAIKLAGKYIYEFYEELKEDLLENKEDDETLKIFEREMEYINQGNKPSVWKEYDPNGIRIYVRYFSKVTELGINKNLIEISLYDLFKANGIEMPTPQYIYIENPERN